VNLSSDCIAEFCAALPHAGYGGEARLDMPTRLVHATDNSIYQILPHAVLFPRTQSDLAAILKLAQEERFAGIAFTPRGGGTGTNGQSLNDSVIIDTSRYLNRILEIDIANGFVRVEPGVVLDQLNAALAPHGYFFPPDISPSKSATLGGMVSTDACGKGSTVYGKTGDYVLSLRAVLANGQQIDTSNYSDAELREIIAADYDAACAAIPQMPRGLSAYNIPGSFDKQNGRLDFNRLLAGSEGSLVVLQEIKLKIMPRPQYKAMVALAYDNFDTALRHVGALLKFNPTAIETIDNHIMDLARRDIVWHSVENVFPQSDATIIRAMHFAEFERYDAEALASDVQAFCNALKTDGIAVAFYATENPAEISSIKEMRKKCAGLLGNMTGNRRPIPFMEDTAVPPHHLADYIAELRTFLSSHGLDCGMFGHSDAGCLHTRPALDLRQEEDEKFIRILTDGAVQILKKYGGVLWGEHGKGLRAAYTTEIVGTNYYALMQKIKLHFDPHHRLNPGKIAVPPGQKLLEIDAVSLRGHHDRQINSKISALFTKATECNGNGLCFSVMPDDTMCPSYKITHDRRHSPKGRAGLLREWMRLKSADVRAAEKFAPQVKEALHGCLSCKACTAVCPIHVNIPDMKTDFLAEFYQTRPRPLRDYLLACTEIAVPILSALPVQLPDLFGLRDLPKPPEKSLRALMQEFSFRFATAENVRNAPQPVLIVQDAYTSYFEPQVVISFLQLLHKLGFTPLVIPFFQSGKTFHLAGFKKTFQKIVTRNDAMLSEWQKAAAPMIGIDPAMTLVFRDEYPKALKRQPTYHVQLLQEFLSDLDLPQTNPAQHQLFLHCSEKTAAPQSTTLWQNIFAKMGMTLSVVATGCCGMAGAYGHQSEHINNSRGLYDLSWRGKISRGNAVTGYSCRSQISRCENIAAMHPVQILNSALQARE